MTILIIHPFYFYKNILPGLLLVKVCPHGDVGLLRPVHHGELRGPSLVQDGEGEAGDLVGELARAQNVNQLQCLIVPDLIRKSLITH